METYIKLFRRFQNWGWYNDPPTKVVFLELMLRARFEPREYRGVKLSQGQCIIGRKELAKKLGLSEQNVRTALEHLQLTNEITIKSTNRFSVVTVENWEKWQVDEGESTSEPTSQFANNQPATNQQLTTNKECKEDKECKDINIGRFKKPTVEEIQAYMNSRNDGLDAETFFDYYESRGWMIGKNHIKDWKACVRTWERRRSEGDRGNSARCRSEKNEYGLHTRANPRSNGRQNSASDDVQRYADEIERRANGPNPFAN